MISILSKKCFTVFFTIFSIVLICSVSGCLDIDDSDPVVGIWMNEEANTTVVFHDDYTYSMNIGLFETSGIWKNEGIQYAMYSGDAKAGVAVFDEDDLHIRFGSGLLEIDEIFIKNNSWE